MIVADFTFDEALHEYRLDGQRLPSVTQLLAPIKPDFSMVPPDVLEAKRALGVAVHFGCELDDLGELDDDSTDPVVMRYVAAWRKFKAETAAVILANERKLYHPTLRFAGTIDRVAEISLGREAARGVWLIDLKTGDEAYPSFGVQLAGYKLLAEQEAPAVANLKRATVHLSDVGGYRFHQYSDHSDEATFMACLALNRWKEKHAA